MTGTPGRRLRGQVTRARVVNAVLILALVLVVAGSALIARHTQGEQASFAGTDSIATDLIASQGHTSWFDPLLRPGSSEVESGLFALQAALGAGVLGYCWVACTVGGCVSGAQARASRPGAKSGAMTSAWTTRRPRPIPRRAPTRCRDSRTSIRRA